MQGRSREALRAAQARLDDRISAAGSDDEVRELSDGLSSVALLLEGQPTLRRALTDPVSVVDGRRSLVDALFSGKLAAGPLEVLRDLAGHAWDGSRDLVEATETLAQSAAMSVAERAGALDEVEDELFRFSRLLDREPSLRAALTDHGLPDERKTALVGSLLDQARPETVRLVQEAVVRAGGSLESRLSGLSDLAAARRQRMVAHVRVAQPLAQDQADRLAAVLQRIYGHPVALQVAIDPDVLGGVEVRVGDEVLDGTVSRRLASARLRLVG